MAAVDNELFVIDQGSIAIKVFSLAGAHLRSFGLGDCERPEELYHFDGRLYLKDEDEKGTCIIVLTPEGGRLQVWRPAAGRNISMLLGIYGRKLLMRKDGFGGYGIMALQGI